MKRWLMAMLALTLIVGACSDDDGGLGGGPSGGLSAEEQELADVIAAEIMTEASTEPGDPLSDPVASQCLAEGVVAAFGVGRLAEWGFSTAGNDDPDAMFGLMTDAELNDFYDVSVGCIDFEAEFAAEMEAEGLSPSSAACFASSLAGTDFFRDAFLAGVSDGDVEPSGDALVAMMTAATDCLSADELEDFFGG